MSMFDRVLLSIKWLNKWCDSKQYILDRSIWDHCAIIFKHKVIDLGPKQFRTLDVWGPRQDLMTWSRGSGEIFGFWKKKIKRLKSDLKKWNWWYQY